MIPKNKKISVLHPYVNKKGGAVKMMIYLSNYLVGEGNDIKFYTFSYDSSLFSQDINFEIIEGSKLSIAYKIRESDFIIIGNSPMQFVGAISKSIFRSGAKLIWWHHHYPWYYSENTNFLLLIKRYLEKLSLKQIDIIVVNSSFLKEVIKKIYNRDSKILNPVVDDLFILNSQEINSFDNKIIFSYSRWVKGKNLGQIFDTYSYLQGKSSDFKLLIGGEGEEIGFFKERFKTDKNISFLGLLDNESIIVNLKKSHIFLFPSKIDSFGMVALEAQISGVPIIAFNVPGVNEIIINNETGFLVEDSKEFSIKTLELLNDDEKIKKFSTNSKKIINKYNFENFKKQLDNIF